MKSAGRKGMIRRRRPRETIFGCAINAQLISAIYKDQLKLFGRSARSATGKEKARLKALCFATTLPIAKVMITSVSTMAKTDAEASGVIEGALALLRKLAVAPQGDFVALKQAAKDCVQKLDETRELLRTQQRHRLAPERSVDSWILDMFTATESAISREQLVTDFVARYRRERNVRDHERHAGPWLLDLSFNAVQGDTEPVVVAAAGVHPDAMIQLARDWLPHWLDDPYLAAIFKDRHDIDAWHPLWFGASPLLDRMLNVGDRYAGEADYWVNGVMLAGDGRSGLRGLLIVHPNGGTLEDPRPPPNMKQDQRLLLVLSLAWRQLEHQIRSLARLTEADRRAMIQLLAPGVLHHEIGSVMNTLASQSASLGRTLTELSELNPAVLDFADYARQACNIDTNAQRVYAVTDAFNNLDRRAAVEDTDLDRICHGVRDLLTHRLGQVGVDLRWPQADFQAATLRTDAVLLSQALLNICNNALNAFAEGQVRPPRFIRLTLWPAEGQRLVLAIINNGPAIADLDAGHIFERGYTTRTQGHGQGLYLSRLITRYLGGELFLLESSRLPEGFRVGFRLSLLRELPATQGLARAG